jgi:hypothetical protein
LITWAVKGKYIQGFFADEEEYRRYVAAYVTHEPPLT